MFLMYSVLCGGLLGTIVVGVKGLRVSKFTTLTPVTNITSETFERVYENCNTTFARDRVVDTGTLSVNSGGSCRLVRVAGNRHPANVRLFKGSPRIVRGTIGSIRARGPSFVSFGFKYPTPGVTNGNSNSTLLGAPSMVKRVLGDTCSIASGPVATGVEVN